MSLNWVLIAFRVGGMAAKLLIPRRKDMAGMMSKAACSLAIAAIFILAAMPIAGAQVAPVEDEITYDFTSPENLKLSIRSYYYDEFLVQDVYWRARIDLLRYIEEIENSNKDSWWRIDNIDIRFENFMFDAFPLTQNLAITGRIRLDNTSDNIPKLSVKKIVEGRNGTVTLKFPAGYLSLGDPQPNERRRENSRDVLTYGFENYIELTAFFSRENSGLGKAYFGHKSGGDILLLTPFVGIAVLTVLRVVLVKKREKSGAAKFLKSKFIGLVVALNGLFLLAVGAVRLSVLSTVPFFFGALVLLLAIDPGTIFNLFLKARANLDPSKPAHHFLVLTYLNILWPLVALLAMVLANVEFRRAFNLVMSWHENWSLIPFLLVLLSLAFLVKVGFSFSLHRRKRTAKLRENVITLVGKLSLAKKRKPRKDLLLGFSGALVLFAASAVAVLVFGRVSVYGGILSGPGVVGAAVIAVCGGFGSEFLFRCLLQPKFGIALTSILFGVFYSVYGFFPNVVLAAMAGVLLGWIYSKRRNIWGPAIAHSAFLFLFLMLLI
ncbi:MAG: CPBP family intramembrane glutamic endopeptidase [Candidatus Hadarchaeota archaeon]